MELKCISSLFAKQQRTEKKRIRATKEKDHAQAGTAIKVAKIFKWSDR